MKKIVSYLLCVALLVSCLALTACGGKKKSESADLTGSKYLGTWKTTGISFMDESEALDESNELGEVTLTLLEDGTGHMDSAEEVSHFTWEEVDGGFKTSGDVKMTFKEEGNGINYCIVNRFFVPYSSLMRYGGHL